MKCITFIWFNSRLFENSYTFKFLLLVIYCVHLSYLKLFKILKPYFHMECNTIWDMNTSLPFDAIMTNYETYQDKKKEALKTYLLRNHF